MSENIYTYLILSYLNILFYCASEWLWLLYPGYPSINLSGKKVITVLPKSGFRWVEVKAAGFR